MYWYIFIGLFVLTICACQSSQAQSTADSNQNSSPINANSSNQTTVMQSTANLNQNNSPAISNSLADSNTFQSTEERGEIVESFSDDSKIGVPRKNKIEIFNFKKAKGNVAEIKFYSLVSNGKWKLKQRFEFEKDDLIGCDPEVKDFNNDGFKDVTYVSDVAARGSNEIRKLFVYDRKKDELIYIKNSEDYPNLVYNKELNCLDAFMFHGGTTSVFLRLKGDVLKEFARVDNSDYRVVYSIDENGKEKLLRKDKIGADDVFTRYKNFNPLKEYAAEDLKKEN